LIAYLRRGHCREGDTEAILENRTSSMYIVLFSETYQRAIQIYCRQMFDDIPFQMLSEMEIAAVLLSYIHIFRAFSSPLSTYMPVVK